MNFSEWFNPYDITHVKALKYFVHNGTWPNNFLPTHCNSNISNDLVIISDKLARIFIENCEDIVPILDMKKLLAKVRRKKK
jgi:hypothetical protein